MVVPPFLMVITVRPFPAAPQDLSSPPAAHQVPGWAVWQMPVEGDQYHVFFPHGWGLSPRG